MYNQGDIIAVNYPFSDQPAKSKLRPAIVISNQTSNEEDNDLLICPITTTIRNSKFSYVLEDGFMNEPLPYLSEVRCNKITTIRASLVLGKVTELEGKYLIELIKKVKTSF